jgi:hypothetical protein
MALCKIEAAERRHSNDPGGWAPPTSLRQISTGERMQYMFQNIQGHQDYKHEYGEISIVKVELAVWGTRHVRIAKLQLEIQVKVIRDAMSKYGDVNDVTEEYWSRVYRYKASTDIRIVELNRKQNVPSHMIIA